MDQFRDKRHLIGIINTTGSFLIVLKEKYTERYVLIRSIEELENFSLKLFNERLMLGWYDDRSTRPNITDGWSAYKYLLNHSDSEYEEFRLVFLEKVSLE